MPWKGYGLRLSGALMRVREVSNRSRSSTQRLRDAWPAEFQRLERFAEPASHVDMLPPMQSPILLCLHQTFIGDQREFPRGRMTLDSAANPTLTSEWAITARLRLVDNTDNPPETLIIEEILDGQRGKLLCWAVHCQVKKHSPVVLHHSRNR